MAIYLLFCSPLSSPQAPPLPSPPPIFFHHRFCRHHCSRRILQSWSGRGGRRPYNRSALRRAPARASAALALESIKTSLTNLQSQFTCFSCPCLLIILSALALTRTKAHFCEAPGGPHLSTIRFVSSPRPLLSRPPPQSARSPETVPSSPREAPCPAGGGVSEIGVLADGTGLSVLY